MARFPALPTGLPRMSSPADHIPPLLSRALAGDSRAANELAQRFILPILDVAVSKYLCGPRAYRWEKEDVIQEVFKHLYENRWDRLRPYDAQRGSLAAYLWTITGNWLRDHERKIPPPVPVEEPEEGLSPDSGPESKVELGQILDRIARELSPEDLALFQWLHLEDIPRTEVAVRLQIGRDTLDKRVQRLDARVRSIVSPKIVPEPMGEGEKP